VLRGDLVGQLVYDVLQLRPDQKQQLQTGETTCMSQKKTTKKKRAFHTSSEQYRPSMQQIAVVSENIYVLLLALEDSAEMELTDNGTNEIQK
jgi:hypothetical protein